MPIYEYACNKCGKTIEVIQKFSDPPFENTRNAVEVTHETHLGLRIPV
jgi:predicted nucleic acid-binding Zn ribbon protein